MKSKIAPVLLAATLLGSVSIFAQTTVTSDPVGFVNVSVNAGSDAPMSMPLHRTAAVQTNVVSVAGNVITISATVASGQFAYNPPSQNDRFYVRVKSTVSPTSAVRGAWFEVVTNGTSSITVEPDGAQTVQDRGLAANDVILVIPFWTLNTLFPSGQGITPTPDIDSPQDEVNFVRQGEFGTVQGTNLQISQANIYSTDPDDLPAPGWYNKGTFAASGNDPIPPDTYIIIRNLGVAKTLTVTGVVPTGAAASTPVGRVGAGPQDNFTANPFPIPVSPTETGLIESGVFQATTDIDDPKDELLVYNGSESGANVQPSAIYIYSTDPDDLPAPGWYNKGTFAGPLSATDDIILPGRAFIVRKTSGAAGSINWIAPRPYTP